jgi:dihydropteroate synthase
MALAQPSQADRIAEPRRRDPASVWLAVEAARRGAAIVRVHDVAGTRQALAVSSAMR